jgi:SAM-dependent methyltransferase
MPDPSLERNRRAFTAQAEAFADPPPGGVLDPDWVFARLPRTPRDLVLDLAAGTGLGARSLAPEVRACVALDLTDAMLAVGARESRAAGLTNIVFMRGEATALPFLDGAFDIVLMRYALHHFAAPAAPLAEIKRVLRPRGWLGLADMVVSEDPTIAAAQNRIEALRDPSHARALSPSELQAQAVEAGFEVVGLETREVRRPLAAWLEQTATPEARAAEIRELLEADLGGGAPSGLQPQREPGGELSFVHVLSSLMILNRDAV